MTQERELITCSPNRIEVRRTPPTPKLTDKPTMRQKGPDSPLRWLTNTLTRMLGQPLKRLYFKTIEQAGPHKREILVTRVELARDSLEEAKTQFQTALEKFSALTAYEGGNLESLYRDLKIEYDYSRSRALLVEERIGKVRAGFGGSPRVVGCRPA